MLNNKAFFMPTIMLFIFLFISYLLFQTYECLNYKFLLSSYENEIYLETGILKSKEYANDYMKKGNNFLDICEEDKFIYEVPGKLKVVSEPICFITVNHWSINLANKILGKVPGELEVDQEEYNKLIKDMKVLEVTEIKTIKKLKKRVDKEIKELELSEPEIKLIVEGIKLKVKESFNNYISFNTKIIIGDKEKQSRSIVYVSNFNDSNKSTIRFV